MARDTSKLVTIPGELHSAATGNIVAATQEIFDYDSNSYQSKLNKHVYNVSAHDSSADAKYTLEEAISAIPESYHVGGLILTFVSKQDDFEIYQLKSKEWDTDTSKWSIVPNNIVHDNPEYIEVHLDGSEKILYGVQKDGNFYFGAGVPSQIKGYVEGKSADTDRKIDYLKEEIDSSLNIIDASIMDIETRFYNVNAHDGSIGINYTLEEAISAVPEAYRNGGLILTFNSDGLVQLYQCKLDNFSENINDWTKYTSKKYVDESLSDVKQNVDSSISELKYKTSEIQRTLSTEDDESIILATDDNVEVTKISVEKTNDESEVLEFTNESSNETYAKIGVVNDKKGIFTDGLYDLNGNPYPFLQIDSSNDILILAGKKYKMIPYIET